MTRTPYQEALDWINHHPGTESAAGMVKLLLSLSDSSYAFSLRECAEGMDEFALAVALRVVSHYARIGDANDRELLATAQALADRHPRLAEVAEASTRARQDLAARWQQEDDKPA